MRKIFNSTLACICFLFSFYTAESQLEPELRLIPIDCEYGMTAFLAGAPNNNSSYDWGDGVFQTANWAYVEHVYDAPGVYTVVVVNGSTTYVGEVSIEDCSCPTSLGAPQVYGQCSSVSVAVETYIYSYNEYNVEWTWGDGSNSTSGWGSSTGYHSYAAEGNYEICGFFTGPGCEDGVELCTSVTIEFCEEPCYYDEPYIELNENTCTYSVGLIEAPQEILWTVNGEEYPLGSWLSDLALPDGDNLICMEISPNLDWNCPLGYSECFEIFVDNSACTEPELTYEETACGLVQFEFDLSGAAIEVLEVSLGDGVNQTLTNGQNFEHTYYPFPGEYEVCVIYAIEGATFLEELCTTVIVEGCPEQYCWAEMWGYEEECGIVQVNLTTEFGFLQNEEILWDFGDGTSEYGFSFTEHEYSEPGVYVICAETWNEFCPFGIFNCFTIEIEGCEDECSEPLAYQEINCGEWSFSVGENWSVEFAVWNFGDGTIENTSFDEVVSTTHEYTASGSYEVCVNYYDLSCNGMIEECFMIEVDVCDQNCQAQLVFWEQECGEYYFEIVGVDNLSGIEWDFGDGFFEYSEEPFISHTFETNGDFFVCPWFWFETCQEEVGDCCIDIVVDCHDDQICNAITYTFTECLQASFVYEGNSEGLYDQWQVSFNGQVLLDYETMDGTFITFPSAGLYTVGVTDALNCDGLLEPFFIEVWVEGCPVCPEIFTEYINCLEGGFFYEGEIEGTAYCWELWSNGSMLTTYYDESYTEIIFPGPGEYQVGVTNALNCEGDFEVYFITVVVEGCETECEEITVENLECDYGVFSYSGSIDTSVWSDLCWEVYDNNGSLLATYIDGELTDYYFATPGTYTVLVTNAVPCNGVIPSIEITVEGCDGYSCGCIENNLLENGDFESGLPINSDFDESCTCQTNSICVGHEPRDKCSNAFWIQDLYDHTYGTPNGNFLIVDGGNGNVWNDQVSVIAGGTYNFSMWIVREISDSPGNNSSQNLYTQVNGVTHEEFTTADATPNEWAEYCFYYVAEETGVITVGLFQESGQGYNDWGLDDVYFGTCENTVECEFESYVTSYECGEVEFVFSQNTTEGYVDFGDGNPSEYVGNYTVHTYETEGWYEVCVEYFNNQCNEWLGDCFEVYAEGCDEPCENYITAESTECGFAEVFLPQGVQQAWVDFGDGISGEFSGNYFGHEYEESGLYTICTEYYNAECEDGYYGCTEVYIEGCEEDCTPLVLSFDGDFGDLENYTELLECVIGDEFGVVWEGVIPLSTIFNEFELPLCLPDGCYSFSITNSNPLLLASLGIALQSVDSDDVDVEITLDIISGTLEVNFGIGADCTVGIEEIELDFLVYPVPASDVVNILFESNGWDFEIVDISGRLVHKSVNSSTQNRIDATLWANGLYLIKAMNGVSLITKKFQVKN